MISYEVYKVIHLTSLVVLLTSFAIQFYGLSNKLHKILTGITTLLVLVSGMGLMARLGIGHGSAWPTWIYVKFTVWFAIGVGGALIVKRVPALRQQSYWFMLALFFIAAYAAVNKFQ